MDEPTNPHLDLGQGVIAGNNYNRAWSPGEIAKMDAEIGNGILAEIREVLEFVGCHHGKNFEDTPPLWYPEAVLCAVGYAREQAIAPLVAIARKGSNSNKAGKIREQMRDKTCKSPNAWAAGFHCGWRAMRELILAAAEKAKHDRIDPGPLDAIADTDGKVLEER